MLTPRQMRALWGCVPWIFAAILLLVVVGLGGFVLWERGVFSIGGTTKEPPKVPETSHIVSAIEEYAFAQDDMVIKVPLQPKRLVIIFTDIELYRVEVYVYVRARVKIGYKGEDIVTYGNNDLSLVHTDVKANPGILSLEFQSINPELVENGGDFEIVTTSNIPLAKQLFQDWLGKLPSDDQLKLELLKELRPAVIDEVCKNDDLFNKAYTNMQTTFRERIDRLLAEYGWNTQSQHVFSSPPAGKNCADPLTTFGQ